MREQQKEDEGNQGQVCFNSLFRQMSAQNPGQKDSQVDASLQNQNLRTDLRWVAKRIRKSARKFTKVAKSRRFHAYTVDL